MGRASAKPPGLRVWIVDTPGGLCRDLEAALKGVGHQVRCVGDKVASLPPVRETECDVLLLGIELPGDEGLERLRRFESGRLARQVPVIVVANRPELEYELPDAFDFLRVPPDVPRLLADLRLIAESRRNGAVPAELAPRDLSLFQNFLVQHSGLHFDQRNLRILQRGLARRMRALGLSDYRNYHAYLEAHGESRRELKKLLGLLTVGETYFFRYLAHFEALRQQVLPDLLQRNRARRSLRLWSAGCSTGEEAYSLAILLRTHFPGLRDWEVRILATDINHQALNKARAGIYGARSLRVTDPDLVRTWFHPRGKEFELDAEIRDLVEFRYLNLQTSDYAEGLEGASGFDVIFCRNVLIYFRPSTSQKVVADLARVLRPGGSLFLGHAESLVNLSDAFARVICQRSFYYQMPLPSSAPHGEVTREAAPLPPVRALPAAAWPVALPAPRPPALRAPAPDPEEVYRQGLSAFESEDFTAAAACFAEVLLHNENHAGALVGRAFIHANQGAHEQARACCAKALRADDLCAEAYFLQGLLLEVEEHWSEAREEYRKALLIDLDFVMPHFHLGGIHARLGLYDDARRELRNSLRLLERRPAESLVPYSGGLTREVFLEVCRERLNQLPPARGE
ncbi:CheR family methyltransferase [Geoalkalibacter sp.]|uniref:CheR family methyltransferase n=1 Tax=Geoalkalibacter sp. TaxID=3041440 RepID=UPI00272E0E00|nr:CheR family methyltransferase [Geoalkalibacter sp.]